MRHAAIIRGVTIAATFAEFAAREAQGVSPIYERLSAAVSGDEQVLTLLGALPPSRRQPNLLFAVVRLLGGPVEDPAAFHDYTVANWPAIETELRTRTVQTNEAGRCAVLLPVLAALPQPLALLEVGASAGLCLYPDRYAYRYGNHRLGSGEPVLDCTATGVTPPARLPDVVWRAGLDLNPLDVTRPPDVAWLDALIWPEHTHRRARLRAAAAVVAADPPVLVRGDMVGDLPALAAQAPAGCDARGIPHLRAVPGIATAARGVRQDRPRTARALDRQRGTRRTALRRATKAANAPAPQRARPRRDAAGLDQVARSGDDLVRDRCDP